jgi:ABC-2 type transport system permease protein
MNTRRPPLASFLAFELRRVLRSPAILVWTLAFPVVFYLLNFANKTNDPAAQRWAGTTWAVYFMVSMCAWAAIAAAVNAGGARLAAERANGWTRYLRLTPLPSWAYAAGKVFPHWLQDIAKLLPTYRLVDLGRAAVTGHALNPADMAFLVAWTLLFGAIAAWRYRADQQRLIG